MSTCQVEVGTWGRHEHWFCDPCRISTTSEATFLQRCQARRGAQPLTSSTGLLGPDGDRLPQPEVASKPSSHDEVDGDLYEGPDEGFDVHSREYEAGD